MVICLLQLLKNDYKKIVVVSRGYKRNTTGVQIVSDGKGNIVSSMTGGDEPVLLARKYPQYPVLVAERRRKGIEIACARFLPHLIILDDAFQHRSVHRDCDIVLLNINQDINKDNLLPLGNLREAITNLQRAHIKIVTGFNLWEQPAVKDDNVVFKSITRCTGYIKSGNQLVRNLEILRDKSAIAFCGIANPDSFHNLLKSLHVNIREFLAFKDHYRYTREEFERLTILARKAGCEFVITTEKDLVKWRDMFRIPENLIALAIEMELEQEENIRQIIKTHLDLKRIID